MEPSETIEGWLRDPDQIGGRLRELRTRADLSGYQLATTLGWQQSKVSRIENGQQLPSSADVNAWAKACGVPRKDVRELQALRDEARVARVTFRDRMRQGQAPVQRDYNRLVARSHLVRHVESALIPGMLQVEGYARRILTEMWELGWPGVDDIEEAVAARLERQQYLYDPAKRFEFLVSEAALRWVLCPPAVMREQLDRLQSVIGLERIRFGVIPFGMEIRWTPLDTYQVYVSEGDTVATVETLVGEEWRRSEKAQRYIDLADRLWEEAVEGAEARRLITAAIEALPGV